VTALAAGLAALSLLLILWSYVFYPSYIARLAAASGARAAAMADAASIEAVISAADEEGVIGQRVKNLLSQEGVANLRVRIGCDGCRDATAARAREAAGEAARETALRSLGGAGERVAVVEFSQRRGKAAVLNDLVRDSPADWIVFTDANTEFDPDAVLRLTEPLRDPAVGAVCGRLVLESSGHATPEADFWDRETRVKQAEGLLGVCLGANGAIYAARRALIEPLPAGTAMDDFLIPARIAAAGHRVVFEAGAVAREPAAADVREEVNRRFRLGVGAGQVLLGERWLWNFRRHPLLSLSFISRKAARWLAPVLALAAALAALWDARLRPAGALLLAVALICILLAAARPRVSGIAGKLYYFGVINVALAAGVLAGLAGHRLPAWRRTAR
jgi:cellulose synthase/poly-beta-1,6-N-acetylglucosamine synthase-like glycosyltransferase